MLCTKTLIVPPQVSPVANTSSSPRPYVASAGSPVASTWHAISYTAPSTQPPEMLPTASPSAFTAITAPGGRGADELVATTVASANGVPAVHQRASSGSASRMKPPYRFAATPALVSDSETLLLGWTTRADHAAQDTATISRHGHRPPGPEPNCDTYRERSTRFPGGVTR